MRRGRQDGWMAARLSRGCFAAITFLGAVATLAGSADATEVVFPKGAPNLQLTVPDGWSVEYTDVGVELRSPQKDSVIVAKIIKRDRATVDAWSKQVLAKMMSDGVTVDPNATAEPRQAAPGKTATAPEATGATPAAGTAPAGTPETNLPGNAVAPSFTYAGGPTVGLPSLADGTVSPPAPSTVPGGEVATDPTGATAKNGLQRSSTINGLHFSGYRLVGGKFNGKPTDMELVLFALPQNEFFAVEQQSAPEDNRAAAILSSVKRFRN